MRSLAPCRIYRRCLSNAMMPGPKTRDRICAADKRDELAAFHSITWGTSRRPSHQNRPLILSELLAALNRSTQHFILDGKMACIQ